MVPGVMELLIFFLSNYYGCAVFGASLPLLLSPPPQKKPQKDVITTVCSFLLRTSLAQCLMVPISLSYSTLTVISEEAFSLPWQI